MSRKMEAVIIVRVPQELKERIETATLAIYKNSKKQSSLIRLAVEEFLDSDEYKQIEKELHKCK